ncbi:conjugal transfer protein [Streptomyces sp. NPDC002867]
MNLPKKSAAGGDELAEALAGRSDHASKEKNDARPVESREGSPLWAEEDERSGSVIARRTGRLVVWSVIGLLAFIGVRSIVFPPDPPVAQQLADPQAEAQKDDVPEAAAQQVAARFARSYMTWNEKDPKSREKELAADLPKGADAQVGWDGQGVQLVAQSIPGEVVQTSPRRARVSVDVRVSSTAGTGTKARTVSSWRRLQVPVGVSSGRVLVTGQPALVGVEQPVDWREPEPPTADTVLSGTTRTPVENFFKAWVAGTADQAAAPGAQIGPLGSDLHLQSLDTWTVHSGSGSRRTGVASVRWKLAGAELQQTYRVTLAEVRADGASRWQVWHVSAQ